MCQSNINTFSAVSTETFFTFIARTVVMLLKGKMVFVAENPLKSIECVQKEAEFVSVKGGET
jgi:hypothetical protein